MCYQQLCVNYKTLTVNSLLKFLIFKLTIYRSFTCDFMKFFNYQKENAPYKSVRSIFNPNI